MHPSELIPTGLTTSTRNLVDTYSVTPRRLRVAPSASRRWRSTSDAAGAGPLGDRSRADAEYAPSNAIFSDKALFTATPLVGVDEAIKLLQRLIKSEP